MDPTTLKILESAGWGALGALVAMAGKTRRLMLPHLVRRGVEDGEHVYLVDLGFLAAPLLGAALAMMLDGRPQTALAYGVTAGYAGPAVLNAVLDPFLKKIGMGPVQPMDGEGEKKDEVAQPGAPGNP